MKRILLLSAYRADSHAYWVDWLARSLSGFDWQLRELPGRHFAWRIRSNPLSWLDQLPRAAPDLILATSMVDLATLKGLHPMLADVPAVLYFHENQFAYPTRKQQLDSVEPAMVQIYAGLAADRLLFNSAFNRDSYLTGAERLLAKMPDGVPAGIAERLERKAAVLPVGIDPIAPAADRDRRLIVWNHRWEYDKQPELFADAVLRLADAGVDFRLALLGKRPRQGHPALDSLRQRLPAHIVADGYLPRDQYRSIVSRAGLVVSTAAHEFQGLSMLEAASAGAIPVVPDALCYPEQYPRAFRYTPGDCRSLISLLSERLSDSSIRPPDVSGFSTACMRSAWRHALLESVGENRSSHPGAAAD
jgi:glycosyltransferase involved in cell wall biosynthesis